jgi:hypothetical protein
MTSVQSVAADGVNSFTCACAGGFTGTPCSVAPGSVKILLDCGDRQNKARFLGLTRHFRTPDNPRSVHSLRSPDRRSYGVEYDSRDNETVTHGGMFHELKARVSPQVPGWLPYGYQQLDATFRFYVTPVPRWLSLSWRLVGDVLFGAPPFYELARFDETPAIGGGKAVRGVPAQRYYGKVKLF